MFGSFVLGLAFLGVLLLLARWFIVAEPREVLRAIKIVGSILLVALIVFLALSGRLGLALAALPAIVVWVLRFYSVAQVFRRGYRAARNFARMGQGGASGHISAVETRFLHMTLDHDSGVMEGRVVAGRFKGRDLFTLQNDDLAALLAECRAADGESGQVLEAYLDRQRDGWRQDDPGADNKADSAPFAEGAMDEGEALKILGLASDADAKAVKAAHKRLMAALHPDHGGSTYLAAKINQAKDVLLKTR